MSDFIAIKCPNCGANIELNVNVEKSICKYCNSVIVLEDFLKDSAKNLERIRNIKKFIEIEEYENALNIINEMLQENSLNFFALVYQVKIMVYLFDFDNLNSKSTDFLDKNWRELKEIIKNYDRVCKINEGVPPKEFDDINNKVEMLKELNDIGIKEKDICVLISEKLNIIWNSYQGDKNDLLEFLNQKIGLSTNCRTVSKLNMMRSSQNYEEEECDKPFTYYIGNMVLQKFEYKRDYSVEVTYDTVEEETFAVEYYGKITKYTDFDELICVLDEIINNVCYIKGK